MGSHQIINDYIAGALGGAAGLIVGHPFDTTKVQLQTRQTSSPYKNTWDAMKNINQSGMIRGFFRGLGFPLVSYGVVNSVFFGVYGNTISYLKGGDKKRSATSSETFLAGCCGGFFQLFVACPVDVVKVVLQSQIKKSGQAAINQSIQTESGQYFRGPIQCTIWLYRQHGLRGMYHGFSAMLYRDVPTFGVYTLVYESLYRHLMQLDMADKHGVMASLLAGGFAGVACWSLAIPFDNVKSLMQADQHQNKFRNTLGCIKFIYKHCGINGFFTGLGITCLRAFPVNAVTFLVYEKTLTFLNREPKCV